MAHRRPRLGHRAPPRTAPTLVIWESGLYQYAGRGSERNQNREAHGHKTGNIIAIGNDQFTYDRLSRLKTATINRHPHSLNPLDTQPAGFVSLNYTYDVFGNITGRQQTANLNYTVGSDPALELFTGRSYAAFVNAVPDNKIHAPGFLYDGNGNLISDGKKDFVYDELNEQVEVHETIPGGGGLLIESNLYGADGMRAVRSVPSTTVPGSLKQTVYVRLGGNVVKEYTEEFRTASSTLPEISHEKAYIYGPLGLLATEELCSFNCTNGDVAGAPTTRYYEYDHLGTIRAISDKLGKLVSTFDYEPFGLELKGITQPWWTDTSSNTHKFTGHERDEGVFAQTAFRRSSGLRIILGDAFA